MYVKILIELLELPKVYILKRKDEIYLNGKVTKVEKKYRMIYGENLSIIYNGKSAAKPRIGESSTTIPKGSRTTSQ